MSARQPETRCLVFKVIGRWRHPVSSLPCGADSQGFTRNVSCKSMRLLRVQAHGRMPGLDKRAASRVVCCSHGVGAARGSGSLAGSQKSRFIQVKRPIDPLIVSSEHAVFCLSILRAGIEKRLLRRRVSAATNPHREASESLHEQSRHVARHVARSGTL